MNIELTQQAREILLANDRGGFTVPTARLYPYQWNWDSAFVALGFATFDRNRAWRELELLVEGQWPDGMIPHILFRRDDPDYFPGPSVWKADLGPVPSGGISQPPVLASVMLELVESGDERDFERADALFDAALKWHSWWHDARTPDGCPAVCTVHPWESGRDNSPDWDIGLDQMEVRSDLEPYERMDTKHADASQRPSKLQYDKYVSIIMAGRASQWDQKRLTNAGPFLMADPGIHFILLRADRDLLKLAEMLGRDGDASILRDHIEKGEIASDFFWNARFQAFCARDVRSEVFSDGFSSASALCFYASAGTSKQRAASYGHIQRIGEQVAYLMPSWDPGAGSFQPQRYWCGPLWPQMNTIIAKGLGEQGHDALAQRVRGDLAACIRKSGFRECFDPLSGDGCIGTNFSWTAAMWLAQTQGDGA
ncbi:MAG: hypothetical protein AAF401_06315 [Pseudomonadota bacterium]